MNSRPEQGRLDAATASGRPLRAVPPNPTPGEITALRAETQVAALGVHNWPSYGSVEWLRLDPQDARVYVATLEAAELHRRAEDERARVDWLMDNEPDVWWAEITDEARRETSRRVRAIGAMESAADVRARQARAGNRPPREVTATKGWPPIAIPGRPGWYRHLVNGQQVDLPTNRAQGNE
ncbi:hypothetical protein ACIP79_08220 [Streptomyces sp. NPDC088747]|uniref:hypothetical protein n=1 Tax=Streptomyces sp. NPDC088747 TaxID=3365886 RepID=UPI003800ADB0